MPGHLSAAEAPEDLWRCHECGWTYPNHHPSAKHRRNHKKQCGKIPGFLVTKQFSPGSITSDHQNRSSDEASSDEEHRHEEEEKNGHRQVCLEFPASTGAKGQGFGNDSRSWSLHNDDAGALHATSKMCVEERTDLSTRCFELSSPRVNEGDVVVQSCPCEHGGRKLRRLGSAHAPRGQWICRHCGWAYPNAHPSAKSRRKHKKCCGVLPQGHGGGSSDDASSSDDGNESANGLRDLKEPVQSSVCPSEESSDVHMIGAHADLLPKEEDVEGRTISLAHNAGRELSSKSGEHSEPNALHGGMNEHDEVHTGFGGQEEKSYSKDSHVAARLDEGGIRSTEEDALDEPYVPPEEVKEVIGESDSSERAQVLGQIIDDDRSLDLKSSELDGPAICQEKEIDVPVEVVGKADSRDSPQVIDQISDVRSLGVKSSELDGPVDVCQEQVNVPTKKEDSGKQFPTNSLLDREVVGKMTPNLEEVDSESTGLKPVVCQEEAKGTAKNVGETLKSQLFPTDNIVDRDRGNVIKSCVPNLADVNSAPVRETSTPAKYGQSALRALVGSPLPAQPGVENWPSRFSTKTPDVRVESLTLNPTEERSDPGTPEGLVRCRVQIFEKLASTSPQYASSPRVARSPYLRKSGVTDGRERSPVSGSHETGDELQEVMSHLRHRGNFVRGECDGVAVERTEKSRAYSFEGFGSGFHARE